MDIVQAKQIINILSNEWKIKNKSFLLKIVDFLDKNNYRKSSFFNKFEFSLVEKEPKIRLLHLWFWQPDLPIQSIKRIIGKRELSITSILKQLSREFKCSYNLSLLRSFFQFNKKTGLWPIQFGLEYQKKSLPKIKVYLSVGEKYPKREEEFSCENFFDYFNLNFRNLNNLFKNKKFDAIAIDLLPTNRFLFKLYPCIRKNYGYLYRILPSSVVKSVKTWHRFPQGLLFEETSNFFSFPLPLKKFIEENGLKIHYLCNEEDRKSIYFR
jgi:hypothetical protein